MSKFVIAGGSGFIGRAITDLLVKLDHEVVVLGRRGEPLPGARGMKWDGHSLGTWAQELDGARAVINLTGHPISVKWTPEAKKEIIRSRVESARVIAEAIRNCGHPPVSWVNASAIGFYGNRGAEELSETAPAGPKKSFLVDSVVAWEETFRREETPGTRKNLIRIGIVLGRDGGALPVMLKFTRMFLGGHQGAGDQYMSWIHVDDLARVFLFAVEHELPEIVNGTAPVACTNRYFMAALRGVVGRPWSPPVPAFALRIASTLFGLPDPSLVLEGQRVTPKVLQEAGFRFTYEEVREALLHLTR